MQRQVFVPVGLILGQSVKNILSTKNHFSSIIEAYRIPLFKGFFMFFNKLLLIMLSIASLDLQAMSLTLLDEITRQEDPNRAQKLARMHFKGNKQACLELFKE